TPLDSKLDQLLELLRNPRDPKHATGIHEACVAFHQQPHIAPRRPIQLPHRRRIQSPLPLPPPHYPRQRPIQLPHRHRIQSPLPLPPPHYPLLHPLQHPHSRRCPSQHPYPHHQHHPHPHPHSHPHQPPIQRPRPGPWQLHPHPLLRRSPIYLLVSMFPRRLHFPSQRPHPRLHPSSRRLVKGTGMV
ncbi:hypothetical protein DFH08DRAFT_1029552, partial [Mycena albidolilacea]